MSSFLQRTLKRSKINSQNPRISHLFSSDFSLLIHKFLGNPPHSHRIGQFSHPVPQDNILISSSSFVKKNNPFLASNLLRNANSSYRCHQSLVFAAEIRFWSSEAASELSNSDRLTVDGILANNWTILDENEGDWKSHAAAVAQSINLIKRRLQVKLHIQSPIYSK